MTAPSPRAAAEIHRINTFFPLLPRLGERWARARPWEGRCIALNGHLTTLTGALVRELTLGGGEWVVCAASEATTDPAVVTLLRELDVAVHTGGDLRDRHLQALDAHPDLVVDVGFELLGSLLDRRPDQVPEVRAAAVFTATGIERMRGREALPLPVLNLNDGHLKPSIENRRGVGEAFWAAVRRLTGMHLSGRRVLVVGYGPVGQGLAQDARSAGAVVEVVEIDPIRRLVAHYDGYSTPGLAEGLARSEIVVTATGRPGALPLDVLLEAAPGRLVLANAGHGGDEFDVPALLDRAAEAVEIGPDCELLRFADGRHLALLGGGHPLNIVLNSGSPEPVLLHFAVLGLALEWMAGAGDLAPGEHPLPRSIEEEAARLALDALAGHRPA